MRALHSLPSRPSRREWLASGAVFAAGAVASLAAVPQRRIIDAHTHFYDTGRPGGTPWPSKTDPVLFRPVLPPEYLRLTKDLGITGTIEVEASPLVEDNQWVLDLAAKEPVIVGTVGHLEPGKPDFGRLLDRFHRNKRFRGIRIGTLWGNDVSRDLPSKTFFDDLRALAEAELEVDLVGEGDRILPAVLAISDRVPDLRIVIDHLPFQRPEESASLPLLRDRPLVFAKVSNVPRRTGGTLREDLAFYRPALDQVFEIFGPDRVLYGSNWPVSDKVAPFAVALKLVAEYFGSKGADVADRYFYRNAGRAYRIPLASK